MDRHLINVFNLRRRVRRVCIDVVCIIQEWGQVFSLTQYTGIQMAVMTSIETSSSHTLEKLFSQPIFFFFLPNENNKTVKMMREDPNKKEATVKTCEASASITKKKTNKNWWKILEFGGLICQIKKLENMRETITTCLGG